MTVSELIEQLKTYPQDAAVFYQRYSDYSPLSGEELSFHHADSKQFILRAGGTVDTFRPREFGPDETPNFISAVLFPGN